MRKRTVRTFAIGFIAGMVLLVAALYAYARLGYVDPRASAPVSSIEADQAMTFLDASIGRRAPDRKGAVPADEANLTEGMKLYQSNCAGCHGDVNHPDSPLVFYPRAPQFLHDTPDMEENENFYLIKHGIRWSGMPAWNRLLTDRQIWQVSVFLAHMDKLPASVGQQWRTLVK